MAADTPRLFALNITDHPEKGSQVGVVAKRTYRVRAGRCIVSDEQVALVEAPRLPEDRGYLAHDIDTILGRRSADVIVVGRARPFSRHRMFDARVRLGRLDRTLRVFGDRKVWRDRSGALRFSEPAEVESVDVGWVSAYGGVDQVTRQRLGDPLEEFRKDQGEPYDPRFGFFAYPRNRAGKGYLIEDTDEALAACALPNIEDPTHLLAPERLALGKRDRWPGAPLPAALGWLSYNYFPRQAMAGLTPQFDAAAFPPASFPEVRAGALNPNCLAPRLALPKRFDLGIAQQAAVGMRVAQVAPQTAVELRNLHPREPAWAFTLSDERPNLLLQLPDEAAIELEPKIRTVLLEPEEDRVCVTWIGEHVTPSPVGPTKAAKIRFAARWQR